MERIFCIKHEEKTPSLVVYETHAYCFGGCGRIELSELGLTSDRPRKERYVENVAETLRYIDSLPTKEIRGFTLPYDHRGYYCIWPDRSYYKLRLWNPRGAGDKYRGATGQPKPPFWAARRGSSTLAVVEGEFSALSLAKVFPEWDVMSPGSASDFKTEKFRKYALTIVRYYRTVIVQTDRDGAGTEAAIHTKGMLLNKVPNIHIVLLERDANEILTQDGTEVLRQEVQRHLPEVP